MNKKEIVKKDLLRRKINEYFSKYPKAKSVIINSGVDAIKTIWRVVKEDKGYFITEVNTNKENFIIEAPVGGQEPAPGAVQLGTQRAQPGAMNPEQMSAGEILSLVQTGALGVTSDILAKLFAPLLVPKDRTLKNQLKNVWDILNKATKKDAASASFLGAIQNLMNTPEWLRANKETKGSKLSEADETPVTKVKQGDDVSSDPIGMEKEPPEPEAPEPPAKEKTQEELVMSKSLVGKPIESTDLELKNDGVVLTLKVAGVDIPAKFEFFNTGKFVFHFKDRPYIIKRA